MAIKKAFQPIIDFLEENSNSKVKSVLDEVRAMCSAKKAGTGEASFIKDADGNVTHIRCYYHGKWEPVNPDGSAGEGVCEYGKKANTATGLNSMCKEGVSNWTKQQSAAKKANQQLLDDVVAGTLEPSKIPEEKDRIEKERTAVIPRADGLGSDEAPAA